MDLKRVPVGLDEPTERPLVPGLRAGQQQTLIHRHSGSYGSWRIQSCHPSGSSWLIGA